MTKELTEHERHYEGDHERLAVALEQMAQGPWIVAEPACLREAADALRAAMPQKDQAKEGR